jgi:hypothetical protein
MMMASEHKRAFLRKKVSFTLEMVSSVRDGAALVMPRGRVFQGTEISAGGMGFETDAPLRRGDQLTVKLNLPGENHPLRLTMQVVHVTQLPEAARKGSIRVGAKFDRMPPADLTYLTNYIGATFILY